MVDAEHSADALARLARCLGFWQREGCQYVALPWLAPARYTDATKPACVSTPDLATPYGNLLASGEQAFLMLADQDKLRGSRFVGWTPCFREEAFDATHHFYFTKVEVFIRCEAEQAMPVLLDLVEQARGWFRTEILHAGGDPVSLVTVGVTPEQFDLEVNGLEVGSYGIRHFGGFCYVYGTGCAEPRFTQALRR